MNREICLSLLINAHVPFVREPGDYPSREEQRLFEYISDCLLPLLDLFDRLDGDHIPFRLAMSFSPVLCCQLRDERVINHYIDYLDAQIRFGLGEMDRNQGKGELFALSQFYYTRAMEARFCFTQRYQNNLLRAFDDWQKRGRLEILTTSATHACLPLYSAYPEAIQAQLESAIASYRGIFNRNPQGFYLSELSWSGELDAYLRSYNFVYTTVDTHAALLGKPRPRGGSFFPLRSPSQVLFLVQDFYAQEDLFRPEGGFVHEGIFRRYDRDAGFELPLDCVGDFLGEEGGRTMTGYRYWDNNDGIYQREQAEELAARQAAAFLDRREEHCREALDFSPGSPVSFCSFDGDYLGSRWFEGPLFLNALFREAAARSSRGRGMIRFVTPQEYLSRWDVNKLEACVPEMSSRGVNGYHEMWLDASNDWMYPHAMRSIERMIELSERFPNDTGLKERALNQAAREILLLQASDWPKMLYLEEEGSYARKQIEMCLRNFTTIYESLGSNYISTEWLTNLERRHNCFPQINYRVFRHKRP